MSHLTFAEAMVVGLIQGVSELFPVSSLGHNMLIPALVGGRWSQDLSVSAPESPPSHPLSTKPKREPHEDALRYHLPAISMHGTSM
jgi:hypothetical protein